MKTKEGFMLREVVGSWVLVPLGARVVEFNGLISFSESSALIWRLLSEGATKEQILSCILSEYDVDDATAKRDLEAFLKLSADKGLIEL